MSNSNESKPRNERFLDAMLEELLAMSDTDALAGEDAEELVKLGERLLRNAREEVGKQRMIEAKRKLSVAFSRPTICKLPSVAEAREYLTARPKYTLAARGLNELSDADVLELYCQTKSLEEFFGVSEKGNKE